MLLDKQTMIEYNNQTGWLEVYDMLSGNLVRVIKKPGKEENFVSIMVDGREVMVDDSIDHSMLIASLAKPRVYHPQIVDILAQRVSEGLGITKICKQSDMPAYSTLCRWKRQHPEIEDILEMARRDRAEYLRDEALEKADEASDKNDTPAAALKYEARKWAAGVDHAGRYGTKNKVDVALAATMLVVDTGIRRDERPVEELHGKDITQTTAPEPSRSINADDGSSTGEY